MPLLQLKPTPSAVPSDDDLARAMLLRIAERRHVRRLASQIARQLITAPRASRA